MNKNAPTAEKSIGEELIDGVWGVTKYVARSYWRFMKETLTEQYDAMVSEVMEDGIDQGETILADNTWGDPDDGGGEGYDGADSPGTDSQDAEEEEQGRDGADSD